MPYEPEGYLIGKTENHESLATVSALERALEKQQILESTALLCDNAFTLHFDLCGVHAIMPSNEVQYNLPGEETKDIAILTRVGKPTCFKIVGFKRERDGALCAVLSRRAAQMECRYQFIQGLQPGDIIPARVTRLENFGAFVDIGCGIISLLSIDSISVSRISHPRDRFSAGDRIHVVIKSIDAHGRIFVSQRELLGTWLENVSRFSGGQTVAGIVRSIETYGIFVELTPNLAGLAEWKEDVEVGAQAAVYIKSMIPEKMKLKLVLIDLHRGAITPPPLTYFIDAKKTAHIDVWRYSPPGCSKTIETVI